MVMLPVRIMSRPVTSGGSRNRRRRHRHRHRLRRRRRLQRDAGQVFVVFVVIATLVKFSLSQSLCCGDLDKNKLLRFMVAKHF